MCVFIDQMATEQTEKAFQKQAGVFSGRDTHALAKKKGKGKGARFWKNIGLGFKTPKEAIDGHYVDQNCPFTGMRCDTVRHRPIEQPSPRPTDRPTAPNSLTTYQRLR